MDLQQIMRVAVCAAIVVLCVAGAELPPAQSVAGQETSPGGFRGAAALDQLKQDGQYAALQTALTQARFGASRAWNTASGREARRAPNPAGYEAMHSLIIDQLFTLQQKLFAADGEYGDILGRAVALSGNTLAVGAPWDDIGANPEQGSVYIFTRSGASWTLQHKLIAGDGVAGDEFGHAITLSGDTLVVGAPHLYSLGQGAAYVFKRSGATWTQQQKLTVSGEAGKDFGRAVAISGDTLAISANLYQGSVYVFTRSGASWAQQQRLTGDSMTYAGFGASLALSGDTLAVGGPWDRIGANPYQGSVYIFTRSGASWMLQHKLIASDGAMHDSFGDSVALSGDTLVVGAPWDDIGANADQGSVYVFRSYGAFWSQEKKLTAGDGAKEDFFGAAVALSGDTLAVGAWGDDSGANRDQGSAHVFRRSGGVWTQQQKLTAGDGAAEDFFGAAVALSGDTLAVGASRDSFGANFVQGSAYVFIQPTCPALVFWPFLLPGSVSGAQYQQSVTVNGGAGPYQFWLSDGALPPGLSLAPSGLLSGAPTTPGAYNFTISAIDLSSLCSGSRAYTLTIAPCPTLTLDPPDLPNGATGAEYSHTLEAVGGRPPYIFGVKGALPPGLSLSADGVFSGAPTQAGNFKFPLLIKDANGCASSWASSITITQLDIGGAAAPRAKGGGRQVARSRSATPLRQ